MQAETMKRAMIQMEMDKQMMAKQQEEEAMNQRLAGAKKDLDVKKTARRMAEANIPMNGASEMAMAGGGAPEVPEYKPPTGGLNGLS